MEFSSETVAQGGLGFINPIKVAFSNDGENLDLRLLLWLLQ